LQRWSDAAAAYQRFLAYYPEHEQRAGAVFNLATAHFNSGEYQEALTGFQVVLDSFATSDYVESARKNVEICRKRLGAGQLDGSSTEPAGEPSAEPTLPQPDQITSPPAPTQGDRQP
jgi:TolA-binding protein